MLMPQEKHFIQNLHKASRHCLELLLALASPTRLPLENADPAAGGGAVLPNSPNGLCMALNRRYSNAQPITGFDLMQHLCCSSGFLLLQLI